MANIKKIVSVDGYCDYLESDHVIEATYVKITTLGNAYSGAKLVGASCKYSTECGKGDDCPILKIAKQCTKW